MLHDTKLILVCMMSSISWICLQEVMGMDKIMKLYKLQLCESSDLHRVPLFLVDP